MVDPNAGVPAAEAGNTARQPDPPLGGAVGSKFRLNRERTMGRIVAFHGVRSNGQKVHPAIITRVGDDVARQRVNLTVFVDHSQPMMFADVPYGRYGDGETAPGPPPDVTYWWCWPDEVPAKES